MVILVGPSCSGKTTCYKTLIAAYHRLNVNATSPTHPKVQKVLVNTSAYSMQQVHTLVVLCCHSNLCTWSQLFGNDIPSDFHPEGIIFQLLRQLSSEATDTRQYWLVCDGPVELDKMEVLRELLCADGSVSLNTGHKLIPSGKMTGMLYIINIIVV